MFTLSLTTIPDIELNRDNKNLLMKQYGQNLQEQRVDNDTNLIDLLSRPLIWSPSKFTGTRNSDNVKYDEFNMIVFDSDDGETSQEILRKITINVPRLKNYQIILLASANWKQDHEKYRIIIPVKDNLLFEGKDDYKIFMKYFSDLIGVDLDSAAMEPARAYFSTNPKKVITNQEGLECISGEAIQMYIREARRDNQRKKNQVFLKRQQQYSGIKGVLRQTGQIEPKHLIHNPLFQKYVNAIHMGNCHNGMLALIGYLSKSGCTDTDIQNFISFEGNHFITSSGCDGCGSKFDARFKVL